MEERTCSEDELKFRYITKYTRYIRCLKNIQIRNCRRQLKMGNQGQRDTDLLFIDETAKEKITQTEEFLSLEITNFYTFPKGSYFHI
jgi:hypothetical protein